MQWTLKSESNRMGYLMLQGRRKNKNILKKRAKWGRLFILPWLVGCVFFFLMPMIQAAIYAFSDMDMTAQGVRTKFIGLANFIYIFTQDSNFIRHLTSSAMNVLYQVPVIVLLSLVVSVVIKNKFFGRTLVRAILFFPVIIASGVVITILKEQVMMNSSVSVAQQAYMFNVPAFDVFAQKVGFPGFLTQYISAVVNGFFNIMWKSGVQMVLMLSAVTHIPASAYEAADIEGATGWEKLWKITFPLVSPTILIVIIYSIIDSFTDYGNLIMRMITSYFEKGQYEYSTAIGLVYFIIVLVIVGIVNAVFARRVFYQTE